MLVAGDEVVDDMDGPPAREEGSGHMSADEAEASGNEGAPAGRVL